MSKPRLVLVSALPPPIGGVCTWTRHLMQSRVAEQYEVVLVDTGTVDGTQAGAGLFFRKVRKALAAVAQARRLQQPGALVHINTTPSLFGLMRSGWIAANAKRAGVPSAIHLHGGRLPGLLARRGGVLALRLLGTADRIYVLDRPTLEALRDAGLQTVRPLPNAVPLREPAPEPTEAGLRLLYVGWLIEAKGLFELLRAVAMVDDLRLTLLGRFVEDAEGSVRRRLEAEIERLGLAERVHVAGEVPMDEVGDYYDRCQALVLPSWTEGLPYVVLEAMMAQRAVVATTVGAIPEVLTHDREGLLCPPRDVEALARCLRRLRDDPALRMRLAAAARERVVRDYGAPAVFGALLRDYAALRETA